MATQRDYYEILVLEKDADTDKIKRAYRKMAMKYHPDKNQGDAQAEKNFKEAAEAYEVLSDPQKKQLYDQYGHAGLNGTSGHNFNNMDSGDIFSMFEDIIGGFGGGRRQQRGGGGTRPQRGYDLETQTQISLEEVLSGIKKEISFTRRDACESCKGSGGKPGTDPISCVQCGGSGQVAQQGFGGMFRMVTSCPACVGAGKKYKEKCSDCHGEGTKPLKRVLDIEIPRGIHNGQTIRVSGEGEPGTHNGPRGDLHVVVRVKEHDIFLREDDHLILKLPLPFTQATLGAELEIPTLDGLTNLTINPGTQHGELFRIKEQGLPNLRSGRRGDLAVLAEIEIPHSLTDKQEQLLRDFAATEDLNVLPASKGFWEKIKEYINCILF